MTELVMVVTTVDQTDCVQEWAQQLIQNRLAACVQIVGPITSFYEWEGCLKQDVEWQVQIKTMQRCQTQVMDWLQEQHPYDIPEIVVVPIMASSDAYRCWIVDACSGPYSELS